MRYTSHMSFAQYHQQNKSKLQEYMNTFLSHKVENTHLPLANTAFARLRDFAVRGKLLRGGFVMFAHEMFADTDGEDVLRVATAMELSQSAVLIHDDIMDNDRTRRGHPSLYAQYEEDAHASSRENAQEYGKSMGLVVGDIGLFLPYELLGDVVATAEIKANIMIVYSHVMTDLGIGQMLDYEYATSDSEQTAEEIQAMYALKTGSSTFTLPFVLGALLAGASQQDIDLLKKITYHLGIVFQVKDDELDLYGDFERIGKPQGSDIQEGKKTLIRSALSEVLTADELAQLPSRPITDVQALIETHGIKEKLDVQVADHSRQARDHVAQLQIADRFKELFVDLIDYNETRNR